MSFPGQAAGVQFEMKAIVQQARGILRPLDIAANPIQILGDTA
jgi:hypothetical protein